MNILATTLTAVIMLGLAGCGGGSGVDPMTPVLAPDAAGSADAGGEEIVDGVVEPELVPKFDCMSPAAEATSASNVTVEGVWAGILVDCVSGTRVPARALVQADGGFRIVSERQMITPDFLSNQLRGHLGVNGDLVAGDGTAFRAEGWSTSLSVDGVVEPGGYREARWDGRWSDGAGAYGYFAMRKTDLTGLHEPIRLQAWPARWELWLECCELAVTWTIAEDGVVTGDDDLGCLYAGQADASVGRWFYPLELTVSGCLLEGFYSGVLEPTSGPFNDQLFVYVDDGENRAMRMHFLSWTYD